ncbi:hypothetical protein AAY473_023525, partial [Plecturocebus cupreus]
MKQGESDALEHMNNSSSSDHSAISVSQITKPKYHALDLTSPDDLLRGATLEPRQGFTMLTSLVLNSQPQVIRLPLPPKVLGLQ